MIYVNSFSNITQANSIFLKIFFEYFFDVTYILLFGLLKNLMSEVKYTHPRFHQRQGESMEEYKARIVIATKGEETQLRECKNNSNLTVSGIPVASGGWELAARTNFDSVSSNQAQRKQSRIKTARKSSSSKRISKVLKKKMI